MGENEDGEYMKALVAWEDIAYDKAEGGIGIESFNKTSLPLKMRWIGCLLIENSSIWISLTKACIGQSLNSRFRRKYGMTRLWLKPFYSVTSCTFPVLLL